MKNPSLLDYPQVLKAAYNDDQQALDAIEVNSLVPKRFGKVALEYITSGNGTGEVGTARYYNLGEYQITKVVTIADGVGSAHKTTILVYNRSAESLEGKAFYIYDNAGSVMIWFRLNGSTPMPSFPANRDIVVDLVSGDVATNIIQKMHSAIDPDSEFIVVSNMYGLVISSAQVGLKNLSKDINTMLDIQNTRGRAASPLNNHYWLLNAADDATQYYVWYNIGGAGIDPALAGKTGIQVTALNGANEYTIANNTLNAIIATSNFTCSLLDNTLLIANALIGPSTNASDVTTGFYINTELKGALRSLIATVILEYNSSNELISAERL